MVWILPTRFQSKTICCMFEEHCFNTLTENIAARLSLLLCNSLRSYAMLSYKYETFYGFEAWVFLWKAISRTGSLQSEDNYSLLSIGWIARNVFFVHFLGTYELIIAWLKTQFPFIVYSLIGSFCTFCVLFSANLPRICFFLAFRWLKVENIWEGRFPFQFLWKSSCVVANSQKN